MSAEAWGHRLLYELVKLLELRHEPHVYPFILGAILARLTHSVG